MLELILIPLQPLCELLLTIAMFFLELIVRLLAVVLNFTWLATRAAGIKRLSYVIAAVTGLHLLSALILPFVTKDFLFLLSWVYSWPAIIASTVLFLLASFVPVAVDINRSFEQGKKLVQPTFGRQAKNNDESVAPLYLTFVLAFAIVFGGLSIWGSQNERKTLRERMCLSASEKVSEPWKSRGQKTQRTIESILNKDLSLKLPCPPKED